MAFCIECGAKAPDMAKFCPQCGAGLVPAETVSAPAEASVVATPDVETPEAESLNVESAATEDAVETGPEEIDANPEIPETASPETDINAAEIAPASAASLAAAASAAENAPKSKGGLYLGLAVIALAAAGGGAYAMGLFGGGETKTEIRASAPAPTTTPELPETQIVETEAPGADSVLAAYQAAIKTGRISDLGKFAKDNADSGLAKDAQDAAFASLQRQSTVLAFTTFTKYFPEADMSTYVGPRVNADEAALSAGSVPAETGEPVINAPSIRFAITQRAQELDPFIAQGDAAYAISVIDEMLGLPDLNGAEATYLMNLKVRAETSGGFAAPAQVEFAQPETFVPAAVDPSPVAPAEVEAIIEPALQLTCWDGSILESGAICPEPPAADAPNSAPETEAAVETPKFEPGPEPAYDIAAKPIERASAEFPEAATEGGSCDMFFDVTPTGSTTNIDAGCSDPLFVGPAKDAVASWTYEPAQLGGVPVQQNDLQVKIRFNLE